MSALTGNKVKITAIGGVVVVMLVQFAKCVSIEMTVPFFSGCTLFRLPGEIMV